jgi:hypothetical protein
MITWLLFELSSVAARRHVSGLTPLEPMVFVPGSFGWPTSLDLRFKLAKSCACDSVVEDEYVKSISISPCSDCKGCVGNNDREGDDEAACGGLDATFVDNGTSGELERDVSIGVCRLESMCKFLGRFSEENSIGYKGLSIETCLPSSV